MLSLVLIIILIYLILTNMDTFIDLKYDIPNCYVIHLKKSTDRVKHIEDQAKKTKFHFDYFNAIDAKTLNKEKLIKEGIVDPSYANNSRVEHYACFLSHYNLLKDISEKYEKGQIKSNYSIIFEDDFIINNDFDKKVIDIINKMNSDFDIIFLGNVDLRQDKQIIDNIYTITDHNVTAEGYLIKNKNISRFLPLIKYINVPYDFKYWMLRRDKRILNYIIYPSLVFQNKNFESTIG
jgi:GR25 family glycosyltransferase involved in LPS biosynthesis